MTSIFFFFWYTVSASSLSFVPATWTFTQDCPFSISVEVDSLSTNSIDLKIFDPMNAILSFNADRSVFGVATPVERAIARYGWQEYLYTLHSVNNWATVSWRHRLTRLMVTPTMTATSVSLSFYARSNYALDDSNVSFVSSGGITDTLDSWNTWNYVLEPWECDTGWGGGGDGGDRDDVCPDGDRSGSLTDGRCERDDDDDDWDHWSGDDGDDGSDWWEDEEDTDTGVLSSIDTLLWKFGNNEQCFYKDIAYREIFFRDVATNPHKEEINLLLTHCIVQGVNPLNFDPYRIISRVEFLKILEKLTGIWTWNAFPWEYKGTSLLFPDMTNHWWLVYGLRSYERGLLWEWAIRPSETMTFWQAQAWMLESLAIEWIAPPVWLTNIVNDENTDWTMSRWLAAYYFVKLYKRDLPDISYVTDHKVMRTYLHDYLSDKNTLEQKKYLTALRGQLESDSDEDVMERYWVKRGVFLDELERVLS